MKFIKYFPKETSLFDAHDRKLTRLTPNSFSNKTGYDNVSYK